MGRSCLSLRHDRIVSRTRRIDDQKVYIIMPLVKRNQKSHWKFRYHRVVSIYWSWSWARPQVLEQGGEGWHWCSSTWRQWFAIAQIQGHRDNLITFHKKQGQDSLRRLLQKWILCIDVKYWQSKLRWRTNLIVGIAATQPTMQRPRHFNRR